MDKIEKQKIIKASGFKCKKCEFYSPLCNGLEVNLANKTVLCSICNTFAPKDKQAFEEYLSEKLDWRSLESFRKYKAKSLLKQGMVNTAKKGKVVSRPAFGYTIENGALIPAQNFEEVREIFEEFLRGQSLNGLARNHNLSVNGIKKILKNFTYIGKVKFDNQILPGNHRPLINTELFNSVQNKLEKNKL